MSSKATDRVTTIVIAIGSDATDRSVFNVRFGSQGDVGGGGVRCPLLSGNRT